MPEYVPSSELGELPRTHSQQIIGNLDRYFGAPLRPHLRIPDSIATPQDSSASSQDPTVPQQGDPVFGLVDSMDASHLRHGAEVYQVRCAGCHGVTGDGRGEAADYLQPKPRDFRRGKFKFTSTPYGFKPARQDLVRTIRRGAKGTSMPSFPFMSQEDLDAVIDYVILLSQRGELEQYMARTSMEYDEDEVIDQEAFTEGLEFVRDNWELAERRIVLPLTPQPEYTDESIIAGRQAFLSKGCSKCHGEDGKGQTEWLDPAVLTKLQEENVQINYDDWGFPAPAADLSARLLHGGRRPIDIYRRIHTGITGTPMPNFSDALSSEPETAWHLVHYVLSIVEDRRVEFPPPPAADGDEPAALGEPTGEPSP